MQLTAHSLVGVACFALSQLVYLPFDSTARAANSLYAPASCCEVIRSGDTTCPVRWAVTNDLCRFDGYYVGGGAGLCPSFSLPLGSRSTERHCNRGTWGWDYAGYDGWPVVQLGWWCPPHYQGGAGNYAPDGPQFCRELLTRYRAMARQSE
jgi:hypothetical protein